MSLDPQLQQKYDRIVFPEAVERVYSRKYFGFNVSIVKAGNIADIPNAEPDCRRQIMQWQM
jgi:hypothetical protein